MEMNHYHIFLDLPKNIRINHAVYELNLGDLPEGITGNDVIPPENI